MRLKQFAKPGRGEVREREERWHLRIEVDLKAERQWRDPSKRQANKKLEGTYWKKVCGLLVLHVAEEGADFCTLLSLFYLQDMTVGQIQQATITKNSIPYNPVAGNASSVNSHRHRPTLAS